ncbi:putative calcineurin binding protein [Aspergillus candidus]|uniref:Calcipressin n=1 Tax=Aspergillus candidus TaxID=41067 RepID=A0A2I2FHT0_ASPCN|nr:Calcipressin [Aspergillus candidus]PLB40197.1 Calcipressin [Aspergillus candidus]
MAATMHRPSLSLDMNNLPPLTTPVTPTNTLLLTDLQNLTYFQPATLAEIRTLLNTLAPLNSFSPLPSLRRIICSFTSTDSAIFVRKHFESTPLTLTTSVSAQTTHLKPKVYFGEPTPLLQDGDNNRPKLLEAPQLDKLFFISPPPSPPHGWVMRTEEPPNKEVHASDLASALAQLQNQQSPHQQPQQQPQYHPQQDAAAPLDPDTPMSMTSDSKRTGSWPADISAHARSRSGSTLIYHPQDHGSSPHLPAVMVEDTTVPSVVLSPDDTDVEMSPVEMGGPVQQKPPKTSRPPVELME